MNALKKLALLVSIGSAFALAGCSERVGTGDYITTSTTHEKVTELPQYVQNRIDQNQHQITIHQYGYFPSHGQEDTQMIVENINDLTALMNAEGYELETGF